MAIEIPSKRPGKRYTIVLRTSDFSYAKVGLKGAFGSSASYPALQLDDHCVCCNRLSQGEYSSLTPTSSSDNFEGEPMNIPVCIDCKEHALENTQGEGTAGLGIAMGIILGGMGYIYKSMWGFAAGGAAIALSLLWLLKERRRLKNLPSGHLPGFGLRVAPDQLVVQTPNRELVDKIVQAHQELIFKVR